MTRPVLERFPEAMPAFDDLLSRWRTFTADNPALAAELLAKCDKGIKSRIESSDD